MLCRISLAVCSLLALVVLSSTIGGGAGALLWCLFGWAFFFLAIFLNELIHNGCNTWNFFSLHELKGA